MGKRSIKQTFQLGSVTGTDGDNAGPDSGAGDTGSIFPSGTIIIDPATVGGENAGGIGGSDTSAAGEPRKRRGRKPGSRNASKTQTLDITGVERILLSAHAMLAGIASQPKLAIDDDEAKQLAIGISNVARHYDVGATEKTLDWCNLLMALGMVYGTRIVAISAERAELRKQKKQEAAQKEQVIPGQFTHTQPPVVGASFQ